MVDYKRILELRKEDVSQRGIADALKCSRNTIASVFAAATASDIGFDEIASLDNTKIKRLLFPSLGKASSNYVEPDFDYIHKELARTGVTLIMLWGEYAATCRAQEKIPYQYSFFCELYKRWAGATKATMHISRIPADIIEVDWAGDKMEYVDSLSGEIKQACLFVATLAYSAYSYVEAFTDMGLSSWIDAHIHAFSYFGGSARLLVPDNLRTGVTKASRYEPALNKTYTQLAEHYNTTIVPARIRHPKDKPSVEGSVRHIAYTILGKLRDRRFIGLDELNEAIMRELEKLNERPFQKRDGCRSTVFIRDELSKLNPLPHTTFEVFEMKKAKVAPNYHVQVDGCFYSVPSSYIGRSLDIRLTTKTVEIFDGSCRICTHARNHLHRGAYCTIKEHMPKEHRDYLKDWTPERFCEWAASIGDKTLDATQAILASKAIKEQSYRSVFGLLGLAKKDGGKARLEQACKAALDMTLRPSYTMIKRIWAECKVVKPTSVRAGLGDKGYVRGSSYFAKDTEQHNGR